LLLEFPKLIHGFTTRGGGASLPPMDSFNLGRQPGWESTWEDASTNREILCAALALSVERLVVPGQVHSPSVVWASQPESFRQVDGVATNEANLPILLHFADCVPIVLYDWHEQIVAVAHAGWRGTASGIAVVALKLMESKGANRRHIAAAIGPAIGSCCYPTGDEVVEQVSASGRQARKFIEFRNGKGHPDLKAINALQLLEAGIAKTDVASFCTACRDDLFYSHRKSGGKTGRHGAIAAIKG